MRRLLPVEVPLTGEPAAGAQAGRPRPTPEQILVVGPSEILGTVDRLRTNPISLDGHAFDFQESTLVLVPDPLLQLQTQVVSVYVPMAQPRPVAEGERRAP